MTDKVQEFCDMVNGLIGHAARVRAALGVDSDAEAVLQIMTLQGQRDAALRESHELTTRLQEERAGIAELWSAIGANNHVQAVKLAMEHKARVIELTERWSSLSDQLNDQDRQAEQVREALGVPYEPHQSLHERTLEAVRSIKAKPAAESFPLTLSDEDARELLTKHNPAHRPSYWLPVIVETMQGAYAQGVSDARAASGNGETIELHDEGMPWAKEDGGEHFDIESLGTVLADTVAREIATAMGAFRESIAGELADIKAAVQAIKESDRVADFVVSTMPTPADFLASAWELTPRYGQEAMNRIRAATVGHGATPTTAERAEADAILGGPEWQPMETAPRDGSLIRLRMPPNAVGPHVVARWNQLSYAWMTDADGFCIPANYPTGWKPIPERA